MPSISVVIPVHDDPRVLDAVKSVLAQDVPASDAEAIVAANAAPPAFEQVLARLPDGVRVVRCDRQGPSAGRNAGVDASSGDVVFFLDADDTAQPGWIAEGMRGLKETGADIIVGTTHAGPRSLGGELIHRSVRRARSGLTPGGEVNLSTGNAAIRRHVFTHVRFDETLQRGEDWLFGVQAREQGFVIDRWPAMRTLGTTDARFASRVAKEIVTGWNMAELQVRAAVRSGRPAAPIASRTADRWRRVPGHRLLFRLWLLSLIGLAWSFDGLVHVVGVPRLSGPARRIRRTAHRTGRVMRLLGLPLPSAPALARGRTW